MTDNSKHYDVIIVGGGPVGLSLAACLDTFGPGLKVAVCDRRAFAVPPVDLRASAIAPGVMRLFDALGLATELTADVTPITRMTITDSGAGDIGRPFFLRFENNPQPDDPIAHMVPNSALMGVLLAALDGRVDLLGGVDVEDFSADGAGTRLKFAGGDVLTAPLIVAADGARSTLRDLAGISVHGHDYGQMGVVTTIEHEFEHEQTAYEHFRPSGPFASLPLRGRQSSLVWTMDPVRWQTYENMSPEALAPVIEKDMGAVLGAVEIVDKVQAFPLRLQMARAFVGTRLALIGDAAHVIHPIAGQGLNLGLKDVAVLSETVIDAFRLGQDIGATDVLARYQAGRRFDTALMAMVTDGLNRLFSNDIAPVRALRDFGLGVVDRLPLAKGQLMQHAAGSDGPKLLRGLAL